MSSRPVKHRPPPNPQFQQLVEEKIEWLRAVASHEEKPLYSLQEVCDYLGSIGVTNRNHHQPKPRTILDWYKYKRFPFFFRNTIHSATGRLTTNLLVLAWLWGMWEYKRSFRMWHWE